MSWLRMDREKFGEQVLRAPWMVEEMRRRAEKMKEFAVAAAPFDAEDRDGVHYRDSFEVEAGIRETPPYQTRRAYGRLKNTDLPTALFVEYGFEGGVDKDGRHYPAFQRHRVLGRSLDAAAF